MDEPVALIAGSDRVLLAAADIAEDARIAVVKDNADAYNQVVAAEDVAAVAAAVDQLILHGNLRTVLDRLSRWAAAALPLRERLGEPRHRTLLLGESAEGAEKLLTSAAFAPPGVNAVASRWLNMVSADDVSAIDALWASAFLISDAISAQAARQGEDIGSLADVLDTVRRAPMVAPDLMWDRDVVVTPVPRPPRYRLRTFIDPGSGVLIWSGNEQANQRWDYPVYEYELPIPKELADAIRDLVDRYDDGSEELRWQPPRPFSREEWRAFVSAYFAIVDELRRVLGPAYEISEESHFRWGET